MDKKKIISWFYHILLGIVLLFYLFKILVIVPSPVINRKSMEEFYSTNRINDLDKQNLQLNKKKLKNNRNAFEEQSSLTLASELSFTPNREGFYYSNQVYQTMISEHSGNELLEAARGFYHTWLTVSYNELGDTEGRKQYKDKLIRYFPPDSFIADDSGVVYTSDGYIEAFMDLVSKTKAQFICRFLTNKGLIFNRLTDVCRGVLYYKILSCENLEELKDFTEFADVELGKTYRCIVEADFSIQTTSEDNKDSSNWLTLVRERKVTEPLEVLYDLEN